MNCTKLGNLSLLVEAWNTFIIVTQSKGVCKAQQECQ